MADQVTNMGQCGGGGGAAFVCDDLALCDTDDLAEGAVNEYFHDHSHQSSGHEGAKIDHGAALNGLGDDDHSLYVLVSNMEADRATIATNWDDLTDGGATTLHSHAASGVSESFHPFMLMGA